MQKQTLFSLIIISILFLTSIIQATPVATVSTYAEYDTYTDSQSDTSYDPTATAEAHALASEPGHPDEYGKSDGWATIGGTVKAYCRTGGWRGMTVTASADAAQTTQWLISSETLPIGTTVSVILDVGFKGSLWVGDGIASANASLKLDNNIIYEGSGTRVLIHNGDYTFESFGFWAGDFTQYYFGYNLNTADRITLLAEVGQTIEMTLSLHTYAQCPDAWDSGASSDFSDSGSYTFAGAQDPLNPSAMLDVTFEMVPEPATLLLLSLSSWCLTRKRQ